MHYPDLGSASDWLKENSLAAQPIRSNTKILVVRVVSMDFLRWLLRLRFARAQVATLRNVGCFLRLPSWSLMRAFDCTHERWVLIQRYFCKGYDYGGKADLSKTYRNLKRKLWVATDFSEIIKPKFGKKLP